MHTISTGTPNRTPVVIAAYNEAEFIGRTLDALDGSPVTPLVVVNGPDDGTAAIARGFGVDVIEREEQGKMPALQAGVRYLIDHGHPLSEPILFTDGDSRPLLPSAWANTMTAPLRAANGPAVTSGLIGLMDGNPIINGLRSARRFQDAYKAKKNQDAWVVGSNQGMVFGTEDALEEYLDTPHIWPGEDRYIADRLADRSESGVIHQVLDPRSMVLMSARYWTPFSKRLRQGMAATREQITQDYARRAASTAVAGYFGGELVMYDRQAEVLAE